MSLAQITEICMILQYLHVFPGGMDQNHELYDGGTTPRYKQVTSEDESSWYGELIDESGTPCTRPSSVTGTEIPVSNRKFNIDNIGELLSNEKSPALVIGGQNSTSSNKLVNNNNNKNRPNVPVDGKSRGTSGSSTTSRKNTEEKKMKLELYMDSGDLGLSSEAASATSSGYHSLLHDEDYIHDDDDEESMSEEEPEEDIEPQISGACAMDLLFDSFNPTGKIVHDSLETVKSKQKKNAVDFEKLREEQREKNLKLAKGKKEFRKLERKLAKLKKNKAELDANSKKMKIRISQLEVETNTAKKKYEELRIKFEKKYEDEFNKGQELSNEVEQMRINLDELQRQRITNLTERIAPIIVYGEPSRKTTYKLQLKYLQYEIHPLSQRLRHTEMRVEQEQMKTRQIQNETRILRDRISDMFNKICVITKGLPMNKIILKDLPAKGKWQMLFQGMKASAMFANIQLRSPTPQELTQQTHTPEILY